MILVNANYFKGVFTSFSSLVKESAEFPCKNETIRTCRMKMFFSCSFFFSVFKLLGLKKTIYSAHVLALYTFVFRHGSSPCISYV